MSKSPLDPRTLKHAKEIYLSQEVDNFSDISKATGINRATIRKYVEKEWKLEKIANSSKAIEAFATMNNNSIVRMTQNGMDIIDKSLQWTKEQGIALPPKELNSLVGTLQKLVELQDYINTRNKQGQQSRDVNENVVDIDDPFAPQETEDDL